MISKVEQTLNLLKLLRTPGNLQQILRLSNRPLQPRTLRMLHSKGQSPLQDATKTLERPLNEPAERVSVEAARALPSKAIEGRTNNAAEPLSKDVFLHHINLRYGSSVEDNEDGSRDASRSREQCLLQKSAPFLDPEIVAEIKSRIYSIRAKLPEAVLQNIIEELRTDGPTSKIFDPIHLCLDFDPIRSNVGAVFKGIFEKASELVPRERADRVLDKWLGQTARQKRVSLEVLGQMRQWRHGPEMKHFPSFLLQVLADLSRVEVVEELTTEMAKELCEDWNPVCETSDAYQDAPSPEELSSVAEGLVDMLGDGLEPEQSILPYYRWTVSKYGKTHTCC